MMTDLPSRIEHWPLSRLHPYARNARTHSDEQVDKISSSILEFGFTNPILVDGQDGIIAGHGRLMAAKRLGLSEVPVIVLDHLTEAQRRAYVLADNRLALDAGWNEDMLAAELEFLRKADFDMDLTGFSMTEIDEFLAGFDGSGSNRPTGDDGEEEDPYTKKIKAPIYTPKGEEPAVDTLCDQTKTVELLAQIEAADIPDEVKNFLRLAAARHNVFNYERIAEYYCHASKDVQELMENSALVIIDFERAIEGGFVKLSKDLANAFEEEE
jgi:hypothetical protein